MLSNRIKMLRNEKRITQTELATILNTTQKTISDYERGISHPDLESLNKIASYFDVSTDYLLGKTNNRKAYIIKVADADGSITSVEYELLDKIKGLSTDDLNKILDYVDYVKNKK